MCIWTRCIHVEIVTSLDLNELLLAFPGFTIRQGAIDTDYSNNGSTFRAAANRLCSLLDSTEFRNSPRIVLKSLHTLLVKDAVGRVW